MDKSGFLIRHYNKGGRKPYLAFKLALGLLGALIGVEAFIQHQGYIYNNFPLV